MYEQKYTDLGMKTPEEEKEFLDNLNTEYNFSCRFEKNPQGCHLLADYLEIFKSDVKTAGELYRSNCEQNSFPRSCYSAGSNSLTGRATEKNEEKALEYFKRGCKAKGKESCFMTGVILFTKKICEENRNYYEEAREYYHKGCALSDEKSCFGLADIYLNGIKNMFEKDHAKAFEFSVKACELGNKFACSNVSQMYKKGQGVEKNLELYMKYKAIAKEIDRQSRTIGIS